MIFSVYVLREDRTKAFFDVELGMRDFLNSNENEKTTFTEPNTRRLHGPITETLREEYDCVGVFEIADEWAVFSCQRLTKDPLEYGVELTNIKAGWSLKAYDVLYGHTSERAPIQCLWFNAPPY